MITRCTPLTWKAEPALPLSLLPHFVEQVAKEGGRFLIINGNFINVEEALRHKELAEVKALEAFKYLTISEKASTKVEADHVRHKMERAAIEAGEQFCNYALELTLDMKAGDLPAAPLPIRSHSVLKRLWEDGFSHAISQQHNYDSWFCG